MSKIINESTVIVQIDSSALQGGDSAIVYVSTTSQTIPGQLVTVFDATGFLSSPQTIRLSTTGGAIFADGSSTVTLMQRFSYVTLASHGSSVWEVAGISAFPIVSTNAVYKSLSANDVFTQQLVSNGLVSSATTTANTLQTQSIVSQESFFISSFYVNALTANSTNTRGYAMIVNGKEHIYSSTATLGAGSFRDTISTGGDIFARGNVSSKLGTIYVGGDVTTMSSIRAQRGNTIATSSLISFTSAGIVGPVNIYGAVTCGASASVSTVLADSASAISMNVMSSLQFTPTQGIDYFAEGLRFRNTPITVPSSVQTSFLANTNSVTTSNLTLQSFGPASTLTGMVLGSTTITNPGGSLSLSSIAGNYISLASLQSASIEDATTFGVNYITMNNANPTAPVSIAYPGGTLNISSFWRISSTGTKGTLYAPQATISTTTAIIDDVVANQLDTIDDILENVYLRTVQANDNVMFSSVNSISLQNVFINDSRGSITSSRIDTSSSLSCSTINVDVVSTPNSIQFEGSNTFSLPVAYISSLVAGSIHTSSLFTSKIVTGSSAEYSTIDSAAPYLITSTYQMGSQFTNTTGLGTYFNVVSLTATQNQTVYYSIIDPTAQTPVYLSTPYVNTIAGTGILGYVSTTQIANKSRIGFLAGQIAVDSANTVYVGSHEIGWKVQSISPSGILRTLAGNYQFFYGDGGFPPSAALGPRLSVSLTSPGSILITDISNVRIRYVTTDPNTLVPYITTIAGTGATGYSGDGGLAPNASFSSPTDTATDSNGRIFISDTLNQVIRVITNSTITRYAGTGQIGATGDGGAATAATLNSPFGLAVDSANSLIFTDLSNCALRKISPSGTIQRIAGTYTAGFGGDGGLATSALVSFPRGVAVDPANNIYFCDTGNARVRRIDANTNIITTVAGNGVSGYGGDGGLATAANLSTPTGITTDVQGNLYIADTGNECIRFVNMNTQRITTTAGRPGIAGYNGDTSFANFALLNSPSHVAFDPSSGYYYIADDGNKRIRYVDSATNIIFTAAGNGSPPTGGDGGPATAAVFSSITSIATDSAANIYISDGAANTIRKITAATSTITTIAGTGVGAFYGDGLAATAAHLSTPTTVILDLSANVYFTDTDNQRVRRIDSLTNIISTVAGTGIPGYNGDSISSIQAQLNRPTALAIDSMRALYVGDRENYRIRRLDPTGYITTYAGNGIYGVPANSSPFTNSLGFMNQLTMDSQNQLYMTDSTTSALWRFTSTTSTLQLLSALSTPAYLGDASPLSNAYFNNPIGLAIDASNNLVIADAENYRLRRTYTFGLPLNPVYVNVNLNYTNYFTSTGMAYVYLNGNLLTSFAGSNQSNLSYSITDANLLDYPLQTSNPVNGSQTPFLEITSISTFNYTKLSGTIFLNGTPGEGLQQNSIDSNSGIIMNFGTVVFPYQNNGITIENPYNDISLRNMNYTGSLVTASDPALKENIHDASLQICYETLGALPLRSYRYIEPYISTFQVRDARRLGFLTSEVSSVLPKAVHSTQMTPLGQYNTLDMSQIKYTHLGVTQQLIGLVSTLEHEVAELTELRRAMVAQRNTLL